jgi:hypothetical protein
MLNIPIRNRMTSRSIACGTCSTGMRPDATARNEKKAM